MCTVIGMYMYVYVCGYIRSEFIHWALWRKLMRTECFLFVHHTTTILGKLSTWCFEHSGDISCSLLVNPSHNDESWEGQNTCLWIYYKYVHVHKYVYACVFVCIYMGIIFVCIYLGTVSKNEHVQLFVFSLSCISCTYRKRKLQFKKYFFIFLLHYNDWMIYQIILTFNFSRQPTVV